MHTVNQSEVQKVERSWGVVQQIDLIGRDLTVRVRTGVETFDVPPDCPIFLHGEPIKLRLVQPRDQVCVTFTRQPQQLMAVKLDVEPDRKSSFLRL